MSHNVDENKYEEISVPPTGQVSVVEPTQVEVLPANNEVNEDLVIDQIQAKRLAIVNALAPRQDDVPVDKDDRTFLRDMMNDITSTALKKKQIKSQDKANENRETLVRGLVTGALKDIRGLGNPFQIGQGGDDATPNIPIPEVFDPSFQPVPGEMDEGLHQFEYNKFMSDTDHLDKD